MNNNMEQLLVAYVDGQADAEQVKLLAEKLKSDRGQREELFAMKDLKDSLSRRDLPQEQIDNGYNRLISAIMSSEVKRKKRRSSFLGAAFAAVFCITAGLILFRGGMPRPGVGASIAVAPGGMSRMTLPDGSTVVLKSGSTLSYDPAVFNLKERSVKLDGEAYFDVSSDKKIPFVVDIAKESIKVFGTTFNVQAYESEGLNTIVLLSGSISLEFADSLGNWSRAIDVNPNERCVYDVAKCEMSVEKISKVEEDYPWDDNIYYFNDKNLDQIIERLEKYFSVEIDVDPSLDKRSRFSGAFALDQSITDIINVLNIDNDLSVIQTKPGHFVIVPNKTKNNR